MSSLRDERAELALGSVWVGENDPLAKWAVEISRKGLLYWRYTVHDVLTTETGALSLEREAVDSVGLSHGYEILLEIAPGGWRTRVRL